MITKEHNKYTIHLEKSWDLIHGYGYHVTICYHHGDTKWFKPFVFGYGFHRKNKFTAVRKAFYDLKLKLL